MKKKLLCLLVSLMLTTSMSATFAFAAGDAEDEGGISTFDTRSVSFNCKRISNTKASAVVHVQFTTTAKRYEVTIILQKRTSGGTWISATDIPGSSHYYSGTNRSSFLASNDWDVKKGGLYRLHVISYDLQPDGIECIRHTYSNPF